MIEEVFSIELPVGERLSIKKNRIQGKTEKNRRIAIVTGIHGDEFEGQYICYEVARRLLENITELEVQDIDNEQDWKIAEIKYQLTILL